MYILSFDCANRSLAAVVVRFDELWECEISAKLASLNDVIKQMIEEARRCDWDAFMSCWQMWLGLADAAMADAVKKYDIAYCKVFDVLEGKTVKELNAVERSTALNKCLVMIDKELADLSIVPANVVVEDQMSLNEKSRGVYYCILYHYIAKGKSVHSIKPTRKNKLIDSLKLAGGLSHSEAVVCKQRSYEANKYHSEFNFGIILTMLGRDDIKAALKKRLPDAADAYFQALSWHHSHGLDKI